MAALFNKEYYHQAIAEMSAHAEGKFLSGWMQYAREKHPALYRKYMTALKQINELWDKDDSESIEAFKRAVKNGVDGTKYFADRYQEYISGNMPMAGHPEQAHENAVDLANACEIR
ncbi:MAG TPA: hypothetical protein DHV16_01250 [Nitrospiraceae bacterium]|nr:hypothetical protein [Nitrospiraceae bacterium]